MRPGLVGVGVVLAVLGGGALSTVYLAPAPRPVNGEGTTIPSTIVRPGSTGSAPVDGPNGSGGDLRVHWSSSVGMEVYLYPSAGCIATAYTCGSETAMVHWSNSTHGDWAASGTYTYPILLVWVDLGPAAGTFGANAYATGSSGGSSLTVSELLADAAALTLMVIGGLAVFLGIFLRGGVFRGNREPKGPTGRDDRGPPPLG
ncbi:MAG: hypothetical protein L3K09_05840 [Thermoplasmata archaeon]|nr:hypothetical protein [Thermoplasmata archaeon]